LTTPGALLLTTMMLQIVASLTENSRGIIYDRNIFIIQATALHA